MKSLNVLRNDDSDKTKGNADVALVMSAQDAADLRDFIATYIGDKKLRKSSRAWKAARYLEDYLPYNMSSGKVIG